jgi:hypothetical protein
MEIPMATQRVRRTSSLTLLVAGCLLIVSSVVLFIMPHGRVAYWSDWRLLGLNKDDWGNAHLALGTLVIIAGLIHTVLNWSKITYYIRSKAKGLAVSGRESLIAVTLTALVCVLAVMQVPPVSWLSAASESIKAGAAQEYGEPPWGHAELAPLRKFVAKIGGKLPVAQAALRAAGITVESADQTLLEIARANGTSPRELARIIGPAIY